MSDSTKTPYKGLTKPIPGVSEDTWGTYINASIDLIDAALGGTLTLALTTINTTLTATQAKNTGYRFTGTLSAVGNVFFPTSFRGLAIISNAATQLLICGIPNGTRVNVPVGQTVSMWSDGVNFYSLSSGAPATIAEAPSDSNAYGRKNATWVPVLPTTGGTLTGALSITAAGNNLTASTIATGSNTARSLQDRAAERLNPKDFGAKFDGVASDSAGMNAVLAFLGANATDAVVYVPHGVANYTWGSLSNPGPTNPVHWIHDGVLSGTAPIVQVSRANKGDLVENYHLGTKYFTQESSRLDSQGVVRIDYKLVQSGGTPGAVCTPLRINCDDNAGAVTSMWGAHVQMHSYANVNAAGNWPQNVGISSSVLRYGKSWITGMHITMSDMSNQASSTGAGLLGMEIGHHANGPDDGGLAGSAGLRYGIHLSQSAQISGANSGLVPCEFAMGYQHDGGGTEAVTKSCFGVTGSQTYQVFDARTAVAPPGYTDPVAALRMDPGAIVDFNGASTNLKSSGWKGAAGNYLQYNITGTARLRYVAAAVELWSISNTGAQSLGGTGPTIAFATGATTYSALDTRGLTAPAGYTSPVAAVRMPSGQIIDFKSGTAANSAAGNYLQYTTTGTARLRYMIGSTERLTIPDAKPTVTGSKGGNAALASLLAALAAANLIADTTTA